MPIRRIVRHFRPATVIPRRTTRCKVPVWPLGWGSCSMSDTGRTGKIADQQESTCATADTFVALASADLGAR